MGLGWGCLCSGGPFRGTFAIDSGWSVLDVSCRALGGHDPFPDAVFHTLTFTLVNLSAIGVAYRYDGAGWAYSLAKALWGIAAILLILGWFRRTRQRRERLAELRELEKQTAPEELEPRPMLNGEGSERDPNT